MICGKRNKLKRTLINESISLSFVIIKKIKRIFTIPNLISMSRVFLIPLLFYFYFISNNFLLSIFYFLGWLTDAFDGYAARKLNQVTESGLSFDDLADWIYSFFSLVLIYLLNPMLIKNNILLIVMLLVYIVLPNAIIWMYTKEYFSLHTYLIKTNALAFMIMVIYYLLGGLNSIPFYGFFAYFSLGILEIIIITLILKEKVTPDIKSIFLIKKY